MNLRIGNGYDIHRLVPGRPLILGGQRLEHPEGLGLDGHSDADVLVHAVMDALLGALSLGDIGKYFPPEDARWRGANSLVLLEQVIGLVRQRGWQVGNVDAVVIAERPKLKPHIEAMRSANIIEGVSKRLTAAERKQVLEPYQSGNIFSGPLTEQEVFAKQRGINPQRQTLVINVDFTHPSRDLARQVARLFCDSIKKYSEDDRLMVTNPLVEKARIEIETLEDKVRRLYEQKNDLIKNQKLLSIAKDTNTLTTERSVLVKDREETRKQIDESEILVSVIASYEKENRPLGDIPQIRADSDVAAAQTAISASKIRVSQMIETYTDHDEIRAPHGHHGEREQGMARSQGGVLHRQSPLRFLRGKNKNARV
jgi:2-C-methyl-D-erythritol 2,4-cyclodiphosphate synthase